MKSAHIKSLCLLCGTPTNHEVICSTEEYYSEETGWWEEREYQIIKCKGCDTISFRKLELTAMDEQTARYDNVDLEEFTSQELFPRRSRGDLPIRTFSNIPENLRQIYRETIDAFNHNSHVLCTGGVRAIVDGICNDKSIKAGEVLRTDGTKKRSRNLDGKIEGLHTNGYLTRSNADVLQELRFLGNEALHELIAPSKDELVLAIGIIEQTLENVYEIHHKTRKLIRARDGRKEK